MFQVYNMLKWSYTKSEKYEFIPDLCIKCKLTIDIEIFEIQHKCSFINTIKTRLIPIQKITINKIGGVMENLISKLNKNIQIIIKGEKYTVKTKTWYSIEEDKTTSYIKCELSNNKVLVIIPDDELIYIGRVIENMRYEKIAEDTIKYNDKLFVKAGEGHQFIRKIEFGNEDEVEGKCIFEDYESDNNIISLGILPDKENVRADVYADILSKEDIEVE